MGPYETPMVSETSIASPPLVPIPEDTVPEPVRIRLLVDIAPIFKTHPCR